MIPAYAALAFTTAVALVTARKKIVHAASWAITGLFALWAAAFPLAGLHPRWHKAGRPKPRHAASEDDWADVLRSISSPLRRRRVPPLAVAATQVRAFQSVLKPPAGFFACQESHIPEIPCAACGYDQRPSHADLDQYLTDDAKRYPTDFDRLHPELAGERKPWPDTFLDGQDISTGWQYGDMVFPAPMGCVPEPPLEPLPPRPCPDVSAADWSESDQALCLCGRLPDIPGEPITSEADCPAHGQPAGIIPFDGELTWDKAEELKQRFIEALNSDQLPEFRTTQDVPGPAETASPPPPSGNGAEAAIPPAVASAGPGTTIPDVTPPGAKQDLGNRVLAGSPRPDVDDLDNTGVMAALTDWALHAPLDQVRAVSR